MALIPVPDQPSYGGVRWFQCDLCKLFVAEDRIVTAGVCPRCHGSGWADKLEGRTSYDIERFPVEKSVRNSADDPVEIFDSITRKTQEQPMLEFTLEQQAVLDTILAGLSLEDGRLLSFHFDPRRMIAKSLQEWVEPFFGMKFTKQRYDALRKRLERLDERFPFLARLRATAKIKVVRTGHMDDIADSKITGTRAAKARPAADKQVIPEPSTKADEGSYEIKSPPDLRRNFGFVPSPKTTKELEDEEQKDQRHTPQSLPKTPSRPRKRKNFQ